MHIITSKTGRTIFKPLFVLVNWMCPRFPKLIVNIRFWMREKRFPNLKDPQTLNEKILWLALNTDTTEWSRLSDKCAVRDYIKDCGLEEILVKQYKVWDDARQIDFTDLPQSFILKTTYGSGVKMIRDKSQYDINEIRKMYHDLDKNFMITSSAEKHYLRVPHRIIADEVLINDPVSKQYSQTLIDYKIWCFNGKVHYIWVCMNRFVTNKDGAEVMLYDRDWNPKPEYCAVTPDFTLAKPIPKPNGYEHMLEVAEKLSKPFPVVRCDLYNLDGKVYFGEMTFTSYGGIMDFYTKEFQQIAGGLINLSDVKVKK